MIRALMICRKVAINGYAGFPKLHEYAHVAGWHGYTSQGDHRGEIGAYLLSVNNDIGLADIGAVLADPDIARVWSQKIDVADPVFPLTDPDQEPAPGEFDAIESMTGIAYTGGTRREYGQQIINSLP